MDDISSRKATRLITFKVLILQMTCRFVLSSKRFIVWKPYFCVSCFLLKLKLLLACWRFCTIQARQQANIKVRPQYAKTNGYRNSGFLRRFVFLAGTNLSCKRVCRRHHADIQHHTSTLFVVSAGRVVFWRVVVLATCKHANSPERYVKNQPSNYIHIVNCTNTYVLYIENIHFHCIQTV